MLADESICETTSTEAVDDDADGVLGLGTVAEVELAALTCRAAMSAALRASLITSAKIQAKYRKITTLTLLR